MDRIPISERLKQIMKDYNLRQADILEKCRPLCAQFGVKMNRSDISQYISGYAEPKQRKLYVLALALNVSEGYLMGFDVPRERMEEAPPEPTPLVISVDGLTKQEIEQLIRYKDFIIANRTIKEE